MKAGGDVSCPRLPCLIRGILVSATTQGMAECALPQSSAKERQATIEMTIDQQTAMHCVGP